jgi:hypothetical protein
LNRPSNKDVLDTIRVPREALEAFKKTDPLFAEFLIESGRVVAYDMPGKLAGAQRNGIRAASH